MPYDSKATRRRILEAAIDEFAEHGLAGGRVDRIAAAAPANKKQIYVHFGTKEALFDEVVAYGVERLIEEVPLTIDDLPGYAGRTFDAITRDPRAVRLALWRQLERPLASQVEQQLYGAKMEILAHDRPSGILPPAETLALLLAVTQCWAIASPVLESHATQGHTDRRLQIEAVVGRMLGE